MRKFGILVTIFVSQLALAEVLAKVQVVPRTVTLCAAILQGMQQLPTQDTRYQEDDNSYLTTFRDFTNRLKKLSDPLFDSKGVISPVLNAKLIAFRPLGVEWAGLSSSPEGSDFYAWDILNTKVRLDVLEDQLNERPAGTVIAIREVRGADNVRKFLDTIQVTQMKLTADVEEDLKKDGIDFYRFVNSTVRWSLSINSVIIGADLIFGSATYLSFVQGQLGGAVMSGATTLVSAWVTYKMAIKELKLAISNFIPGRIRENARAVIENRMYYRAKFLTERLFELRKRLEGPSVPGTFFYFGETVPVTFSLRNYLAGLPSGFLLPSRPVADTEEQHLDAPTPIYRYEGPELATDFIYSNDPKTGEPGLVVISRISGQPLPRIKPKREMKPVGVTEETTVGSPGLAPVPVRAR